ncbi:group III truncated hemoglobin [Acidobacterium sp. S8]|uniref:group III truncated hemoglobin n=1 Tax=Acidobacterium sp. S8 TaxID=1641854 RepID=UPI00131C9A08|nr:group III truncated hemoglobin [Acidobacterium sp. S8]
MLVSFLKPDGVNEESISLLIDRFYTRVRKDELLGPIFADAVGDEWGPHLQTMRNFWSSLMLTSGRYKGNPMMVHLMLPRLGLQHFDRWLAIWKQTTSGLFPTETANLFVRKAESMAERILATVDQYHASLSATN